MNSKFEIRAFIISIFLILILRNINFNNCEIANFKNKENLIEEFQENELSNFIITTKNQMLEISKYLKLKPLLNIKYKDEIQELLNEIIKIETQTNQTQNSANFILGPISAISQAIKETKIENDLKNICEKFNTVLSNINKKKPLLSQNRKSLKEIININKELVLSIEKIS